MTEFILGMMVVDSQLPVQKTCFFLEMQMHRRCIRSLKYLGSSLEKKGTVPNNYGHFLFIQLVPLLFRPCPASHFPGLPSRHTAFIQEGLAVQRFVPSL